MDLQPITLDSIAPHRPLVIAGPCSAENEDQMLETARQLKQCGIKIMRAGIWKPRTKPGGFEGVGTAGIPWMRKVKEETGLYTATEVATPAHVHEAIKGGIDVLWIGARTMVNPFAVQELAEALRETTMPVLVKNPVNPDLELWIGGIERLYRCGIKKLAAIHRGFSTYEKTAYRNEPFWQVPIELRRRIPNLPIFCDPSHISGNRELIAPLCQQAMDLGFDGLMIEAHCCPEKAFSDVSQQVAPEQLNTILSNLIIRDKFDTTAELSEWRRQIDQIDEQLIDLLSKRMKISSDIGRYKKKTGMPILQPARYTEILSNRARLSETLDLNSQFIQEILKSVHEESVRRQMVIMEESD
ncbi:MAG: bifunctional 3-deoxy-7-phosphoheptulonate synthase/chorismate mutase type II [Planctomycetaceae bacterium]|nr:bifunctional 3-deoxy-7-phosphoheptulonate synthase/chorismate mutase type II [Planctomycetaceae bacterium]